MPWTTKMQQFIIQHDSDWKFCTRSSDSAVHIILFECAHHSYTHQPQSSNWKYRVFGYRSCCTSAFVRLSARSLFRCLSLCSTQFWYLAVAQRRTIPDSNAFCVSLFVLFVRSFVYAARSQNTAACCCCRCLCVCVYWCRCMCVSVRLRVAMNRKKENKNRL